MSNRRPTPWLCDQCDLQFNTRALLSKHKHAIHNCTKLWNKGKTRKDDVRVAAASNHLRELYKAGSIKIWCQGKKLSDTTRLKMSNSMKLAHAEGRAHNIGQSRWNNEPSYPEKWFMSVIENEFDDKKYVRELPFHRYALDFAWIDKKRCIEIDGEQHQRFESYRKRDIEKDSALKSEGWSVLRLDWKYVFNNAKEAINTAKTFIDTV